jgi:hypothetical protein
MQVSRITSVSILKLSMSLKHCDPNKSNPKITKSQTYQSSKTVIQMYIISNTVIQTS